MSMNKRQRRSESVRKRKEALERSRPIAAQLLKTREKLNMSQREMGEKLGVTGPAIAQWETGVNPIPPMAQVALRTVIAEHELD